MAERLNGRKVAILVASGFEQVELTGPMQALQGEGATIHIVSPAKDAVQGFQHMEKGDSFPVDVHLDNADPSKYDALMLPGGLFNPDHLRTNARVLDFVRAFFAAGKPVAAICHGPQVLISAGLVKGRRMTGWEAIQVDLANAGAIVSDEPVVTDKGLVTSRKPDDIPAFNKKMIEEFAEGRHAGQSRAA